MRSVRHAVTYPRFVQPIAPSTRRVSPPGKLEWNAKALGVAAVLATLACDSGGLGVPDANSLASMVGQGTTAREIGRLDLAGPDGWRHLLHGFTRPPVGEGATLWSAGVESVLEFFVAQPRDLPMAFDVVQVPHRDSGIALNVEVAINGTVIGVLEVPRLRTQLDLLIPADTLREGRNTMRFRYPETYPQKEVVRRHWADHPERRAVIWYGIQFGPDGDAGARAPHLAGTDNALAIPFGARLELHRLAQPSLVLQIPEIRLRGAGPVQLSVRLRDHSGKEVSLGRFDPGSEPLEIPLDVDGPLVSVSLTAASALGERGGQLELPGARFAAPDVLSSKPRPHIVVYLVDTLRRDHLGVYGYDRPLSPRVDALASEGVVFDRAEAQSSWTRPSVVSFLTGLNPRRHGATETVKELSEDALTLAEFLRAAGYQTAAFSANSHVSRSFGLAQGFSLFQEEPHVQPSVAEVHAGHVAWEPAHAAVDGLHEYVFDWLAARKDSRPLFLFVHAVDPHEPYQPGPEMWQRFASEVKPEDPAAYASLAQLAKHPISESVLSGLYDLYDAEIATADERFGALLDELKRAGLYEDAVVVFLSDHGEEFQDHGRLGHGQRLYAETQRVPLVVRPAGGIPPRRADVMVSHVDLLPTLLEMAGLSPPSGIDGRSVLGVFRGEPLAETSPPIFAHVVSMSGRDVVTDSVTDGSWKLIHSRRLDGSEETRELYALSNDAGENQDVAAREPAALARMRALLDAAEREQPDWSVPNAELDPALRRQLQAMGYLQTEPDP